jgi:SAM-dependent methyltransferase
MIIDDWRFKIDRSAACSICGALAEGFKDLNGRPLAICNSCGSAERQRQLSRIYERFLQFEHPLQNRKILSMSPAHGERKFLTTLRPAQMLVVDARPDLKPDMMVDYCHMPEIDNGSFDAAIASGVLSCVYDLAAALREIRRVLAEGGIFLHTDIHYAHNQPTIENTDPATIAAWYGQEAYEQKRVGWFRRLGDLDFIALLQEGFVVKTYYGEDAANGLLVVWHAAVKRSDLVPPRGRFLA